MNRWIVIINKSPRGPLTAEEVETLLKSKHIRYNDLACYVEETKSQERVEWKFIWQFPEFNRRAGLEKATEDRREPAPLQTIENEKSHLLPEELSAIRPEDLVYQARMRQGDFSRTEDVENQNHLPVRSGKLSWIVFSAASFALLFAVVLYNAMTFTPENTKVTHTPKSLSLPLLEHQERNVSSALPSSPLQGAKAPIEPAIKKSEVPKALVETTQEKPAQKEVGEKGEISYSDYRRKKEEQLEKEESEMLSNDEEALNEDDAENDEEMYLPLKKTKKKAKKRKITSEDEEADPLEEEGDL